MAIPGCNLRYQTLSLKFGQVYKYTYWETMNTHNQWRTQEFYLGGGGSTNSVEDRENGDLGAVAP
jgi:hypothetical protein